MASVVGICNRALQRLGAARIASLADNSKSARACNAAYEPVRDALMRSHPWSFAIRRKELAADTTAPPFGPANQFPFPADALRILKPRDPDCDWIIEGRSILTDWAAPLQVRYVALVTDANTMDPLFREALSAALAYEMCEEVTNSNTKKRAQLNDRDDIITEARRVQAIERGAQLILETPWISQRA